MGALPRRCRPKVKRIGTNGALHSRSAIPRRFNRSLTSPRQFRLPSTGLAEALDLENLKLLGYYFAMLRDFGIVIPLSFTHDKLYPGSATPRQLARSLTCCLPCLTAHLLHLKLLLYDYAVLRNFKIATPLSCTNDKHHPGSTTPRWLPRRLTWCVPSHTAPAASHVSRLATPVLDVHRRVTRRCRPKVKRVGMHGLLHS